MFGIGVPEFFTVLILALIVLGPERLPIAMRTVGRWVRRLREQTREFRQEFAEEFSILYEEMDVLRQEAETTRKELADIRADLTDTLQGAADDVNAAGSGVVQDLRETIESFEGDSAARLTRGDELDVVGADGEGLSASDAMAFAIRQTFTTNGQLDAPGEMVDSPGLTEDSIETTIGNGGLSAYAPDVSGPVESDVGSPEVGQSGVINEIPSVPPSTNGSSSIGPRPEIPSAVVQAALGPTSPSLQNQMGGFVRLMVMQALDTNPEFATQAEASLRTQAGADADGRKDLADADPRDVAEAWAGCRRHLVPHDSVTVDQKAEESAVIELHTCPYGLKTGDAHPICDVSNTYDHEFFKRFNMKATYTSRMSDGADRCELVVLTHARMRKFRMPFDEEDLPSTDPTDSEQEVPANPAI